MAEGVVVRGELSDLVIRQRQLRDPVLYERRKRLVCQRTLIGQLNHQQAELILDQHGEDALLLGQIRHRNPGRQGYRAIDNHPHRLLVGTDDRQRVRKGEVDRSRRLDCRVMSQGYRQQALLDRRLADRIGLLA